MMQHDVNDMQRDEASAAPPRRGSAPIGPIVLMVIAASLSLALIARTALRLMPRHELPDLGAIPTFTLTDQGGRAFGGADMRGKAWVVDFFFSRCTGICPNLAERMRALQTHLGDNPD